MRLFGWDKIPATQIQHQRGDRCYGNAMQGIHPPLPGVSGRPGTNLFGASYTGTLRWRRWCKWNSEGLKCKEVH